MKIFVTGGSGFVVQIVISVLIKEGHEIHALVRSKTSAEKVKNIGCIPVMDNLLKLSENFEKALANCDAVLHSPAHMDFTYEKKPYHELNVEATNDWYLLPIQKIFKP